MSKKSPAELTTKNIEGAKLIWEQYDKDLKALKNRVKSLEQNETMNEHRMMEMEIAQGKLKTKLEKWNEGIKILIAQIESHDSKPNWRPEDN